MKPAVTGSTDVGARSSQRSNTRTFRVSAAIACVARNKRHTDRSSLSAVRQVARIVAETPHRSCQHDQKNTSRKTMSLPGRTFAVYLPTNWIYFRCAIAKFAPWFIAALQSVEIDRGVGFLCEGEQIVAGWTTLTLVREPDGLLWVHEPDYASPHPLVQTRGDVTTSLAVLAEQKWRCVDQERCEPAALSFRDVIVVARGSLDAQHIYLERTTDAVDDGDSGWFVGFADQDDEPNNADVEAIFVFQLLTLRPQLLPMLTLPAGYLVVFQGDSVVAIVPPASEATDNDAFV